MASEIVILGMLVLGAAFMIFEAIAPGADLIVVGVALFATGLFGWAFPWAGLPVLLIVFLIIGGPLFYLYRNRFVQSNGQTEQTSGSKALEYREGVALEEITQTGGRVKLDEGTGMSTKFQARCKHGSIEEGTRVIVTDAGGGSILEVMPSEERKMDEMFEKSKEIE